jgi:hypothetical protein
MGVPREKAAEVLERIETSARLVGFIEEIKGKNYISLSSTAASINVASEVPSSLDAEVNDANHNGDIEEAFAPKLVNAILPSPRGNELTTAIADDLRRRRVFITHGQNRDLVEPIRKLLEFGEMEAVVP